MSAVKDLTPKGKNIVLSANMKRVEFGNSSQEFPWVGYNSKKKENVLHRIPQICIDGQ